MDGTSRAITSVYNADDSRHSMTYPNDGNYIVYNRDNLGRLYYSALNGSHELFYPARDSHGRTTTLYRLDPATSSWSMSTSFGYDPVSRLSSLTQGLAGTSYDATTSFTYNPASQIASRTQTNDAYAWTGAANVSRSYTPNALNQLPGDGSATYGYDADGNLASATHVFDAGTGLYDDYTYTYDAENRLVTAVLLKREPAPTPNKTITTNLRYDPLGRLYEVNDSEDGITRFLYDGDDLVAEYNSAGTLLRRYVHGDRADEPEVWFEGSGVTDAARRYLYADERGSIVAVSDSAGKRKRGSKPRHPPLANGDQSRRSEAPA